MSADILLVDDDPDLREVVRYALTRAGYTVREAGDGAKALVEFRHRAPDLVVLDVMMPELDGIEVCRRIRQTSQVPIVFLSSRSEELDRILGLEMGGDDYIAKPFSPRELVSRIKAVLRRTLATVQPSETAQVLESAGIRLDPTQHRVWVHDAEITLTVTEFRILQTLMQHPGRAFARSALIEQAYEHFVSERTLDSHVRRIRQKLREHGCEPIETVHGLGFRLATPR